MALHTALNIQTASMAETYRHIRDFLTAANGIADYRGGGPGYAVVDESYASMDPWQPAAGDWCVMRSNGEADSWPLYYRLEHGTTAESVHRLKLYLGWHETNHTGFAQLFNSNNIMSGNAGATLYLHADLDELHMVVKPASPANFYWHPFGRLKHTLYSDEAISIPTVVAAGSSTVITLPSWPAWAEAGRKIYNWDGSSIHELTITEADAVAGTITVATSYAKTSGSWLAEDMLIFGPANGQSASPANVIGLPRRTGTPTGTQNYNGGMYFAASMGPDGKYGERSAIDIILASVGETRGKFGLVRETCTVSASGTAWQDTAGKNWRLYAAYSNKHIALRDED